MQQSEKATGGGDIRQECLGTICISRLASSFAESGTIDLHNPSPGASYFAVLSCPKRSRGGPVYCAPPIEHRTEFCAADYRCKLRQKRALRCPTTVILQA